MIETSTGPWITDWIGSLSNLVSAVFVGFGLAVAWYQLGSWREQARTQKRVDLAANILSTSFEILDVLSSARNPLSSVPREKASDPRYIYQRRMQFIQDHAELFITLRKAQIQTRIFVFDKKIDTAIQTMFDVRNDLWNAADMLVEYADEKPNTNGERCMLMEARSVLFGQPSGDKTRKKLDDSMKILEVLLGEIVRQHK